ncbi:MAG TPA: proprotein convertase P-domain-containing protein [Verrucomicrobiae bacterium]|nr:proprotein convertase P-domain-containing protein [Verrucomicrobiae bacterium]
MATDNAAKQLSSSWGWGGGPSATSDQIYQEMIAQGQSFFHASGDFDAFFPGEADDPRFPFGPTATPFVTQVGGTTLTTDSTGAWASETVWNADPVNGAGSQGGISLFYSIPTWQQGLDMTLSKGSTVNRNIPDVALTADNVYVIADSGQTFPFTGGTSCASPLWAGFNALVNQQAAEFGQPPDGFINPAIYSIAKSAAYASAFHDTTNGNNFWQMSTNFGLAPGLYPAVPGYDCATGLGTPAGSALINFLAPQVPGPVFTIVTNIVSGGNGDGMIDRDDCKNLDIVLTNVGPVDATSVSAILSTKTPGVIIGQRASNYTNIISGASGTNITSFKVSTSTNFVCGTAIQFKLTIKTDEGTSSLNFAIATGVLGTPVRFDSSMVVPIPDGSAAGTNSPIVVSNVTSAVFDVAVSLNIIHPFDADLTLQLVGPDGTTVTLSQNNGGGGQNYGLDCNSDSDRTIFTDSATNSIVNGVPPFVGLFQPQSPLAVFSGKSGTNVNGTWKLHCVDGFAGFSGSLECWSLILTPAACADGGGQCPGTDLAVGLTSNPGPIIVGDNIIYTMNVTNNGPNTATNVSLNETLPSSVIYLGSTASQGTVSFQGGVVTCNMGTLSAGSNATVTVTVQTTIAGIITATALVGDTQTDPDPSNNSVSLNTVVNVPTADLTLSMVGTPNPVLLGGTLTYTINVTNHGPSTATQIIATNLLPASVSFVSANPSQGSVGASGANVIWSVGSLGKGASASVSIATRVSTSSSALGTIVAKAGVSAHETDPQPGNNTATVITQVTPAADLSLSMTGNPNAVIYGSNVTYTLTVLNFGPSSATNVHIGDTFPVGMTYVSGTPSIGTVTISNNLVSWNVTPGTGLPLGASASLSIVLGTGSIPINQLPETATNSASATADQADPNPGNNSASVVTVVDLATNRIVAAGQVLLAEGFTPGDGAIDPGETVTVGFIVKNTGNIPSPANVIATLLPTGGVITNNGAQTANCGILQPGGVFTNIFRFTASTSSVGTLTATIQLSGGATNAVTYNFPLPTVTNLANSTTIIIPDHGPGIPFGTTINVSGLTNPVGKVTVTVTNFNHTYSDDVHVLLVGPSGSGSQEVLLLAHVGGTSGVTNGMLTFDDSASGELPQSSPIVSGTYKPSPYTNPSSTFPGLWPTNFPPGPYNSQLAIYNGASANGSWTLYVYDSSPGDAGSIIGGWSLSVSTVQPVNQVADVAVTGSATPNPILAGGNLTYSFNITNKGPNTATGVTFTNPLPAGLTFVSAANFPSSAGFSGLGGNGAVFCVLTNSLPVGSNVTVSIVASTYPGPTTISSTGTVTSAVSDLNTANNVAIVVTTNNQPHADLAIGLTAGASSVVTGSNASYAITVTNNGPDTAYGVVVTDQLPSSMAFLLASSSQGSVSANGGLVTGNLGTLASGAVANVNLTAIPVQSGLITNQAAVATDSTDTNLANNIASASITAVSPTPFIVPAGAALISGSIPNQSINPGETVTVSLGLANIGSAPTANLKAFLQNSGGISSLSSTQSYGVVVNGGAAVSNSFTFVANGVNGGTAMATLQLQDGNNVLPPVSFTFNLPGTNTFANSGAITIPDHGPANPYPSTINVSGMKGVVSKVTVTLNNFNHSFPHDVDVLVVSPSGSSGAQSTLVMSDTGGAHAVTNVTLTFDDAASTFLPPSDQIVSGTFLPTSYDSGAALPASAPTGPYVASMAALKGAPPNGVWSLFVYDDSPGDAGSIAGGWSLTLSTISPIQVAGGSGGAPTLGNVKALPNGSLTFTLIGISGQTYIIEASSGLTPPNFVPVYTNIAASLPGLIPAASGFRYTNTDVGSFPQRFYRARVQ